MKTDSLILIPTTEYGIPSGNYDGISDFFFGDRKKGVAYYRGNGSTQTVRFRTDEFIGTITIQASLDADPIDESEWFDVYTFPGDSSQDGSTAISADFSTSLTGNFAWIRARVTDYTGGTINSVTLIY